MPYITRAFAQTHPDRLATLARLFGFTTADIDTCRVLELGCASGANLIPMALGLPNASFLGIDFSRRQIDEGRETVSALGLSNIELRHADIAEVDATYGTFDYIVCHGIYSWVPAPIRDKVLAICKENLAPHGVAFVSYNTYPGWHMRDMIRNMMSYHSAAAAGAQAKVRKLRALLAFLAPSVPADTPYSQILKQELELTSKKQDAYLYHEYLEETNQPVYFHEFAAAAQQHGLQYLAEADFSRMLLSNFPPQVAEALRPISQDIVRLEQYMDFVRGRMFRQTLLVHQGVPIQRKLDAQALKGLYLATLAQPVEAPAAPAQGATTTFRASHGGTLTTGNSVTKAAMLLLAERWPLGLPFAELAAAARARVQEGTGLAADPAAAARDEAQLANEMLQCYGVGVIELRVRAPNLCLTPSARPVASPLARLQVERGHELTSLRHEPVPLDEANRQVLRLLDGNHDRDALVAAMMRMARDGVLRVQHEGTLLTEGPILEGMLRRGLEENLPRFARAGLIVR